MLGPDLLWLKKNNKQFFITNEHVINAESEVHDWRTGKTYVFKSSTPYLVINGEGNEMEIARANEDVDIAILKSKEDLGLESIIGFADIPLKQGDVVYAVGHPFAIGKFLSRGIIPHFFSFLKVFFNIGSFIRI